MKCPHCSGDFIEEIDGTIDGFEMLSPLAAVFEELLPRTNMFVSGTFRGGNSIRTQMMEQ